MKKQTILLLLLLANLLLATNSYAQIGKPDQLLGKTVEECEVLLGKASGVDGIGTGHYKNAGNMAQERYYKAPPFARITLTRTVDQNAHVMADPEQRTLSPVVQTLEYQIPKGLVKTWQQAFALLHLSTEGVGAEPISVFAHHGIIKLTDFPGGYRAFWTPAGNIGKDQKIIDSKNHLLTVTNLYKPFTKKAPTANVNQEKPNPAALKPAPLNFMALRGKNLDAYEAVLGKPKAVEGEGFQALRYYKVPGFVRVILFVEQQEQNPPLVTAAEVQFDKSEVPSWKEALPRIGFSAEGAVPRFEEKTERPTMYAGEPVKMTCTFLTKIAGTTSAQWFEAGLPRADRALPANISGVKKPVPPAEERTGAIDPKNHRLYFFIDNSVNLISEAKWNSFAMNGAAGELHPFSNVGGSEAGEGWMFVTTKTGRFEYDAQFFPILPTLQNGVRYTLTFEAKADAPSVLYVITEMRDAPYLNTGLPFQTLKLNEGWKTYKMTFTARNGDKGRIKAPAFRRGLVVGTVWVRGVSLTKATENGE